MNTHRPSYPSTLDFRDRGHLSSGPLLADPKEFLQTIGSEYTDLILLDIGMFLEEALKIVLKIL
jgi:hypothetical protein